MSHFSRIDATPLAGVHVVSTKTTRRFPRHWHGTFGLGVIEQGAQRSLSGRGTVDAHAGQCITHNPGEVHDGWAIGGSSRQWRMLQIEPSALARLLGRSTALDIEWRRPVLEDDQVLEALRRALCLVNESIQTERSAAQELSALFEETLLLAAGHMCDRPPAPISGTSEGRSIATVMERLRDADQQAPTLDELSMLAGMSRFSVVRRFQRRHGLPPLAWLKQYRLQRARDLIATGTSIADSAQACDFSDQSHLTRLFVRQFGYTPGAWRKVVATQT